MTEQSKQVCSLLQAAQKDWKPPTLPQKAADMPQGDMPGDAVHISEAHRTKADAIFPLLLPQLAENCDGQENTMNQRRKLCGVHNFRRCLWWL